MQQHTQQARRQPAHYEQEQQQQDSRRTLIKNQLYLIEQLQLENANLRNERDQLQLENEELKFQLQMISSSSVVLGQPPSSGGVEFGAPATTPPPPPTNDAAQRVAHTQQAHNDDHDDRQFGDLATGGAKNNQQNVNGAHVEPAPNDATPGPETEPPPLTKITATPVRGQPHVGLAARLTNHCDHKDDNGDAAVAAGEHHSAVRTDESGRATLSLATADLATTVDQANGSDEPSLAADDSSPPVTSGDDGHREPLNGCHEQEDEEEERAREQLVQRLYGDCDKVRAAAVVIQRAFRKHQICQRFRAITDQLRHACQPARVARSPLAPLDNRQAQLAIERDNQPARTPETVPYACTGATRAAAWESLSQAANRLAASAAAARQAATAAASAADASKQTASESQQVAAVNHKPPPNGLSSNTTGSAPKTPRPPPGTVPTPLSFQQLEAIRKRQYRVGLNIFNKSPEKGVSFLIAHSFIDCSPPYPTTTRSTTTTTKGNSTGATTNHSYYLANQLHFMAGDKQQQQQQQPRHCVSRGRSAQQIGGEKSPPATPKKSCRVCREEENLKINVAHFLLHRKGLAKEKIGAYLGNLQCPFNQDVLVYYLRELDFCGLQIDTALRKFSSTLRMPGEAQKIERFVDRFASRYVECQQLGATLLDPQEDFPTPIAHQQHQESQKAVLLATKTHAASVVGRGNLTNGCGEQENTSGSATTNNLTLLTKDEIFILTFAIIMLNTDLHSPSLKSQARMSASQFVNNLRGVFKSQTIHEGDLLEIYERVKAKEITTTPDHVTHVMKVQQGLARAAGGPNFTHHQRPKLELPNLCLAHRRLVCFCRLFEVYEVNKKERPGQHQREIFLFNDMLLVTKLARRARANTPQQYTYRQSIMLRGLYVQLFRSAHYAHGLRLCRRANDETLIMFNARNELDQSRFVDDLNESIAEMDEMEIIRAHNIVETIHFKQQDRLRRHALMHQQPPIVAADDGRIQPPRERRPMEGDDDSTSSSSFSTTTTTTTTTTTNTSNGSGANVTVIQATTRPMPAPICRRMSNAKFSSMSNLASLAEAAAESDDAAENTEPPKPPRTNGVAVVGLRANRSFGHHKSSQLQQQQQQSSSSSLRGHLTSGKNSPQRQNQMLLGGSSGGVATSSGRMLRSCSTNSVHSLDSGLFLSRDVSPNQSG